MASKPLAFVAYSTTDEAVQEAIQQAVLRANSASVVRYESWIFNDNPGSPISSPILSRIEESQFVVADITSLNPNVVFEIGYAIGKGKRVFLIRASFVEGDKQLAREAGIFDTLGYFEFSDVEQLRDRLTSFIDCNPMAFEEKLDHKAPIYIVEPGRRNDSNILLISRIKKAGYRYRSFNPDEDVRLSATDAIRQVSTSAGVVALLQSSLRDDADGESTMAHNVRVMFVVGLSSAMDKPSLLLAPFDYESPLDVRDAVKVFRHPDDIIEHVAAFCPEVNSYMQQVEPVPFSLHYS